jgi:hypothetical protein
MYFIGPDKKSHLIAGFHIKRGVKGPSSVIISTSTWCVPDIINETLKTEVMTLLQLRFVEKECQYAIPEERLIVL